MGEKQGEVMRMKEKVKKSVGTRSPSRAEHYAKMDKGMKSRARYINRHPDHLCSPECPNFKKRGE